MSPWLGAFLEAFPDFMIHYALRCRGGHEFDGWFKDSGAFEAQAAGQLLDCPVCGDTGVQRALMAPRLRTGGKAKPPRPAAADIKPVSDSPAGGMAVAVGAKPPSPSLADMPDQMRAVLQRMRAEVERKCEYVGPEFAMEARRIHHGDVPYRAVYGETTQEQAEALVEDGIPVSRIPWVPRADG